jgi:hypothetical protein
MLIWKSVRRAYRAASVLAISGIRGWLCRLAHRGQTAVIGAGLLLMINISLSQALLMRVRPADI